MWTGSIVVFVVVAVVGWILSYVKDWSRDFTSHTAETSPGASDARLRPLELADQDVSEVAEAIEQIAASNKSWEFVERHALLLDLESRKSRLGESSNSESRLGNSSDGEVEINLIHKTAMFGFKDDVRVTLTPLAEHGTTMNVFSQSRIGKGDLGQNPRNIAELIKLVRKALGL